MTNPLLCDSVTSLCMLRAGGGQLTMHRVTRADIDFSCVKFDGYLFRWCLVLHDTA